MRSWTCWLCWGVTSVTLRDLSWRNARRQARDYLVYFVTIVIATALMYAFNGLVFSREIAELSAKLSSLPLVIVLASVAVVLILGWLVAYITRFMLTRRSRELGTYLLIGLEHRQVARLFFLENLAVGAVALVLGGGAGKPDVSNPSGHHAGPVWGWSTGSPLPSPWRRWG